MENNEQKNVNNEEVKKEEVKAAEVKPEAVVEAKKPAAVEVKKDTAKVNKKLPIIPIAVLAVLIIVFLIVSNQSPKVNVSGLEPALITTEDVKEAVLIEEKTEVKEVVKETPKAPEKKAAVTEKQSVEIGAIVPLFGDRAFVRVSPNTEADTVAQLKIGTEVKIIAKSEEVLTIGGYTENWYQVEFNDNGTKSGYVWGGLLPKEFYSKDMNGNGQDDLVLIGKKGTATETRIVQDDGEVVVK
jgi:hypothetical protein